MKTILKKHILFLTSSSFFLPVFAFAQQRLGAGDIDAGIRGLDQLLQTLTTGAVKSAGVLLMAVAMVIFLLGIVQYLWGLRQGKPESVDGGKKFMGWGLVALFVMFSVYGIIKLAQSVLFNSKDINTITIPELNFKAGGTTGTDNNTRPTQPLTPPTQPSAGGNIAPNTGGSKPATGGNTTAPSDRECTGEGLDCNLRDGTGALGVCTAEGKCIPSASSKCTPNTTCPLNDGTSDKGICNAAGTVCMPAPNP